MISTQMMDLYAISSIYFIKGIMDAQSVCNPLLIDELPEVKKLSLIMKDKIIKMTQDQYMKFILSDMSKHNLLTLRGLLVYYDNKTFKKEFCILLDFLYKKGCEMSGKYEGKNMKKALDNTNGESKTFLTPEGMVKTIVWHDMLRKYLTELNVLYKKFNSNLLDSYMVNQNINRKKVEEIKQLDEQRKNFILSGGDVPAE